MLDLGSWLDGRYRVEAPATSEPDDDEVSGSVDKDDD
jgi:endogenous inhibitor of DNA gyrase (YacG/DUF329 family)